jgi:hypothetical protein
VRQFFFLIYGSSRITIAKVHIRTNKKGGEGDSNEEVDTTTYKCGGCGLGCAKP